MDVYEAIFSRRDVRSFRAEPIPDDALKRILEAAHHAGSVGFMQPWNFILIRSVPLRRRILEVFTRANADAAANYSGEKRQLYDSLKLQGIVDAPLNLAVTCDRNRSGPHVLGRNTVLDTDVYSTCCAIQNLWLAARAEGVGVGWVSIFDVAEVQAILGIPKEIVVVAYLCLGYPVEFRDRPLLEEGGWEKRLPLKDLFFEDGCEGPRGL